MPEQQEEIWFINHMEDLARTADQTGYIVWTDFLDDYQRSLLSSQKGRLPVCLRYFGGYPDAEREVAAFYPSYLEEVLEEAAKEEIALLEIRPLDQRFVKKSLSPRDYLGALMGTGIRRDKVGDILLTEEAAYLWTKRDLAGYIVQELREVGPVRVEAKEVDAAALPEQQPGKIFVISVSSPRLDAVVSRGFQMGRGEAVKWIAAGRVYRNGQLQGSGDKLVQVKDKITVRGKGRLTVLEEKGMSKSGRRQFLVERKGQ